MYLTNNLVLSLVTVRENAPRLCYKSIVTSSNISATSELVQGAVSFPASNMANPATAFGWEAEDTATQTITITNPTSSPIDYIGIARHNLAQESLTIQVKFNGVTVRPAQSVSDTQALLFLFEQATPSTIEIIIAGATNPAKIAVVYVGESLRFERNIYVGHTPINYGRQRSAVNGISQAGEYLGQIVTNEVLKTQVQIQNLTPTWYRESLDPFYAQNPRRPVFWSWRPGDYPGEVAYCWVDGNPVPTNQRPNGMMETSFSLTGIA